MGVYEEECMNPDGWDAHECPQCGKYVGGKYTLCYNCYMASVGAQPCEKCGKPAKPPYKLCYECSTARFKGLLDFSDRAHVKAREVFYPMMYPTGIQFKDITPEDQRLMLDVHCGIDRVAAIINLGLRHEASPTISIQERYSSYDHKYKQHVPITEWKTDINMPAELYNGRFQIFVHAFYDDQANTLHDPIAISWPTVIHLLSTKRLQGHPEHNAQSNRDYMLVEYEDLRKCGAVIFEMPGVWK